VGRQQLLSSGAGALDFLGAPIVRILLVQSHPAEASKIASLLRESGAIVDDVQNVMDAITYVQTYEYETVVLDRLLSDMNGFDAVRRFRAKGFDIPVLMLLDESSGHMRADALRSGVDGLVNKPVDKDELIARIEATVRRQNGHAQSLLRVGALEIDMSSREVRVDGQPVSVTRTEYSILELMALRKGRVIGKQSFFDNLYNGLDGPETRAIDVFICNLRKKLSGYGMDTVIGTVRGHGYFMREIAEDRTTSSSMIESLGFEHPIA
jgi:two-component system, cell cycle response regulator CtrA